MSGGGQSAERQLVQTLRGDLSLICSEARKRYPAVREVRNPLSLSQGRTEHPFQPLLVATFLAGTLLYDGQFV